LTNAQPFFVPAIVIGIAAIPLVLGWIPRNRFYGVRVPKTLSDDRVWYRANRFGGCALIVASAIYLAIARAFPMKPGMDVAAWLLHVGAFVVPLFAGVLASLVYVRRL
jgi:uncharacterized membrane protein